MFMLLVPVPYDANAEAHPGLQAIIDKVMASDRTLKIETEVLKTGAEGERAMVRLIVHEDAALGGGGTPHA